MSKTTVTIPAELFESLLDVAEWYGSLDRDVRKIAPEYMERHPDPGAVDFLASEAASIAEQARAYRAEVRKALYG